MSNRASYRTEKREETPVPRFHVIKDSVIIGCEDPEGWLNFIRVYRPPNLHFPREGQGAEYLLICFR